MNYYEILPARKIPQILLTYKSQETIKIGQVVKVSIRNKLVSGIVWSFKEDANDLEESKIKEINEILPFLLNNHQLEFLKVFTQNTFNSANFTLESFLHPFELLTKKQILELNEGLKANNLSQSNNQQSLILKEKEAEVEFYLEKDISFRIRYIIRSILNRLSTIKLTSLDRHFKTILILFPEKKMLDKFYFEIIEFLKTENENPLYNILINKYLGDVSKPSKLSLRDLLFTSYNKIDNSIFTVNIIFGSRSGLFLPYPSLDHIILVDESNTMYIQEQNKLYYDAREVSFLLSKIYSSDLSFISHIPSIRLYNFYPEKVLESFISTNVEQQKKPLKIEISKKDSRFDQFDVISDNLEQILTNSDYDTDFTEHS